MACEYCKGDEKPLIVQPCSDAYVNQAFIEPEGVPAVAVCVDSAWAYVTIKYCPMCGERLGGDAS